MATIYERVRKVTISQLEVSENQVSAASSFVNELGADSLDLVELIMALEDEFTSAERRISIPDEDVEKLVTVQDVVEYLRKLGISDHQAPPKPIAKPGFKVSLPQIRGQEKAAPSQVTAAKPGTSVPAPATDGQNVSSPSKRRRRNRPYGGYDRQNPRQGNPNPTPGSAGNAPVNKSPKTNPPPSQT